MKQLCLDFETICETTSLDRIEKAETIITQHAHLIAIIFPDLMIDHELNTL